MFQPEIANLEQKGQVGPKTRQNFNKKAEVELKMSKLGSKNPKFRQKLTNLTEIQSFH